MWKPSNHKNFPNQVEKKNRSFLCFLPLGTMGSRKTGQSRINLFSRNVCGCCWWQNIKFEKGIQQKPLFFVWGEVVLSFLTLRGWIEECSISHTHIYYMMLWDENLTVPVADAWLGGRTNFPLVCVPLHNLYLISWLVAHIWSISLPQLRKRCLLGMKEIEDWN